MNENMIGHKILDSKREPVEIGILRVSLPRVYVVRSADDPFPQEFVVKHKYRAVEQLELIIPKNMKYLVLRCRHIVK